MRDTAGETARPARPADRYGDVPPPGRRVATLALVALGGGAGVAFVVWAGISAATPDVRSGLVAFEEVTDRSVTVRFEVVKDADATAVCRVRAQNPDNVTVGSAEVEVGPPRYGARGVVEVVVPTTERPVLGQLRGCELR